MTEKLTLEIAMKYPKAKIKSKQTYNNLIHFIGDLSLRYEISTNQINSFLSDCKLILRPLSSLTEEEKKELYSLHNPNEASGFINICMEDREFQVFFSDVKTTDKLREWNIDFESPSLQERGIAEYE